MNDDELYKSLRKNQNAQKCRDFYRQHKKQLMPFPTRCEECNYKGRLDAHHHDYNKALEVTFLCKPCHREWHRNYDPLNRERGIYNEGLEYIETKTRPSLSEKELFFISESEKNKVKKFTSSKKESIKKSHQVQFYDDVWQKAVDDAKGLGISTQQHLENLIEQDLSGDKKR